MASAFAREELALHPVAVHLAPLLHARLERRRRPVTLAPGVVPRDVDGHLQLVVDVVVGGWPRMRSAARCASTSVGLNRTSTSNSSVKRSPPRRFVSRVPAPPRARAERVHPRGVPHGGGFAIDDAAPRGVHVRRHGVFRVAELLVPRAPTPGESFSRISRFTVAELTMFRARSAKRSVPSVSRS